MARRDKRLQRARHHPKGVSFEELCQIYRDNGFEISGGRGSHFIAKLPGTVLKRTFPRANPMLEVYVLAALDAIAEAQQDWEAEETNGKAG